MYCANCGERLIEHAFSCPSCGTEVRQAPLVPEGLSVAQSLPESEEPFSVQPGTYPRILSDQTKKLILVAIAAVVIVFLILKFTGGGGSQATPEKTVKSFMNAVKNEDAKKMVSYLSISSIDFPEGENMDSFIKMLEKEFDNGMMNLQDYKIIDVKIDEDKATVGYEIEYIEVNGDKETDEESFDLSKIKGKWYIDGDLGF